MSKLSVAYFVFCVGVIAPSVALADEKPKTAEQYADEAYAFVQKNDYPNAVAAYAKAYEISADGRTLYNIATIYDRKLHERELASEYYRRYLRLSSNEPELVKRANERLAALKEEEEELRRNGRAPGPTPAPAAAEPAASTEDTSNGTRSTMRTAGLVAMGAGVVGLTIGTIFGLRASSKNDESARLCNGSACENASALSLNDDARSAATTSTVCFVVGGVALAGGLATFLLAPKERRSTALRFVPSVGPQTASLALVGGWQ